MSDEVADLALRLSGSVGPFVADMKRAQQAGEGAAIAAQRVAGSQDNIAASARRASGGFAASSRSMMTGGLAVAGAFVAVGAGALSAVKSAASFETTLRQTAVASGAPASALKDLSKLAIKMGQDTVFSAQDAAGAMLELAKSGMTPAQIKAGALASTLTLASAGGLDLAASAGYVTSGLALFSLKASDSATVASALAGAANASKASVQDMGLALSQVGPGAAQAGLSLQETTAVLAAFAFNGILGSDAGTSLKTMLTRLVPTTKQAAAEMKHLGLNFTDAHGSFLPISAVAQQLHDKLGPLSEKQRSLALSTIFGSDATRAASILMKEGAKGVVAFTKATSDQTQADKLAKAATEGTAGAFSQLSGSIDTAKLRIGQALAPAMVSLAHLITDVANQVGPLVDWFGKHDTTTKALAIALGVVLVGALVAVTIAVVALVFASSPITLTFAAIVLACAAVAAGLYVLWTKSETFRNIVKTAFYAVETAVYAFAYGAVTYIKFFLSVWLTVVGGIVAGAAGMFGWVPGIGGKLKAARDAFSEMKDGVLRTLDDLKGGIKSRMEDTAKQAAIQSDLTAVAMYTPLAQRLPAYKEIAGRYGLSLQEALKRASVPTAQAAKFLAQDAAENLKTGKAAMLNASSYMTAIPRQAIIDGIVPARRAGIQLAQGLADGMLVGIQKNEDRVAATAGRMGARAAFAAKHAADVRSPSGITLYAGEMLAEGFIVGMRSRLSEVVAASQELAAAATAGTVNVADLKAAQARALETPVQRAQLADVNASSALDSARSAAVGPNAAAAAAASAQRAAQARDDSAHTRLKALTSATSAATLAARDHTRALQAAAAAASLHAAQMPSHTKAQQAAKNAAQDYARTLSFQASEASRAATAVSQHNAVAIRAARDQVAAADKALSAAKAAASATASAAKDANKAVTDAATAAVEAHAALADAVYADSVAKAQAFAGDISKQLDVLVAKADTMRSAFSGAALANSSLADLFKAPDGATGIGSLDSALTALRTRVTDAEGLAGQIAQLQDAHLSADLINQISAAGTGTGSAMATAILAGGPEAIAQLNDLSTQLAAVAASGIDGVVGAFYGQGAMSVQQLAEGMRAGFPEIDAVLGEIAAKVTAVLGTSGITPGSANIPSPTPSGSGAVTIIVQPAPTTVTLDGKVIAENSQQHLLQKKTISGSLGLS